MGSLWQFESHIPLDNCMKNSRAGFVPFEALKSFVDPNELCKIAAKHDDWPKAQIGGRRGEFSIPLPCLGVFCAQDDFFQLIENRIWLGGKSTAWWQFQHRILFLLACGK